MRHHTRILLLATALLSAPDAHAQLDPVGYWATSFANPTSSGSRNLTVRVHYPATSAGQQTPLKRVPGGRPAIVFLQGFTAPASRFIPVGNYLAARGYIVLLPDSGRNNTDVQYRDAVAMYSAIAAENARTGGFFQNAFAPGRVGLAGHSMGGGNTVRVLANNPGYLCGAPIAPWDHRFLFGRDYPRSYAGRVEVPLAILYGQGDRVLDWRSGQAFYNRATRYQGLKTLYLLNRDAGHSNVAGTELNNQTDREVFARSMLWLEGFMAKYVKDQASGLSNVVGVAARSEPRLVSITKAIDQPALWQSGAATIGGTFRMRALAAPGPTVLAAGLRSSPMQTPFGPLLLNSAAILMLNATPANSQCLQSTPVTIPNDPSVRGLGGTFQALGGNSAGRLRFTNAVDATVQ